MGSGFSKLLSCVELLISFVGAWVLPALALGVGGTGVGVFEDTFFGFLGIEEQVGMGTVRFLLVAKVGNLGAMSNDCSARFRVKFEREFVCKFCC